ncbi:SDR family oxidoreductase [Niallia nealsonii]|uniref:NAD(P)-dependent dehydrogenase n=1 Tax=Niallia nealsonii TaxID=115979 RepID=A0A2N0YYL4_9BACI|nr:SDR family oxidoreductase [Niallia nealsonii]PKG22335.1 NAD(P)-dependent dehydrogenase [Niallia nealsonii]
MAQPKSPLTQYYNEEYPKQYQEPPAVQGKMEIVPDCGEKSYKGTGRLKGRKALITGGDSGIGRAAAIAYAREGADIVLNYLPEEQPDAEEVKKLIETEGRKAVLIPGDLSDEAFCKELVDKAYAELDGLDVLALVAGKQQAVEDIADLTTEQIRKTFEVNVFSLYWIVKAAMPYLPEGASIITTTSVQGYNPSPNLLDYAATKFAITGFTRGLAKQVASKGIRVNSVAPGPIWTPLQISGGQPSDAIPAFGQDTPLKRAGQPVELSSVYVFLASTESSYVTAQVYGVTGGVELA